MKNIFDSKPVLSFLFIAFAITFFFWFLPVFIAIPRDIDFAFNLIGGCGPLIAAYIITVVKSGSKFRIVSKPLFFLVFLSACIVGLLVLYYRGRHSGEMGSIPHLSQVSPLAFILLTIPFFIIAINASNATNKNLNENYIASFIFDKKKIKWYVLAVLILIVLKLASYLLGDIIGFKTTDFVLKPQLLWFVGFFAAFLFFGANEEFGWRGFLQKELQKKYNPLISALIISFFWSLWHLPLYYNGVYSTDGFMVSLYRFLWMIPLTIVYTWFYNKSNYSILVVMLLHAMQNTVSGLVGSSSRAYLILGVLVAIFCIFHDKMWKQKSYVQSNID